MNFASTKRTLPPFWLTLPQARVTTDAMLDMLIIPCPTVSGTPNTCARALQSVFVCTGFISSDARAYRSMMSCEYCSTTGASFVPTSISEKRGAVCATLLAEPNALPTFIVIALSAGRELLVPASAGALAACLLVAGVGLFVHRPLARVPENTLKFAVGVMLTAFGIYWTGEGLGVAWPGADLAIVDFAALFLAVGRAAVVLARRPSAEAWSSTCCELCFAN